MPAASPEHPPFLPGQYMADRSGSSTDSERTGAQYLGKEFWFDDIDWSVTGSQIKPTRSQIRRKLRVVRNKHATDAMLPKRVAKVNGLVCTGAVGAGTAGPDAQSIVGGYCSIGSAAAVSPDHGFPIDEWLPSTGAPANSLFYVVVEGPAVVKSGLTQFTAIVVGDPLVCLTAATSNATTSGRVVVLGLDSTTLGVGVPARIIGAAMSACTSQGYHVDVLVNVGKW